VGSLALSCLQKPVAVLALPCDVRLRRRQRAPPATIRPRRCRAWLGAVEIGEMGCLDAGQGGERSHAVGFFGGVTGGEETSAGALPCSV
jgi:hypothetical protein